MTLPMHPSWQPMHGRIRSGFPPSTFLTQEASASSPLPRATISACPSAIILSATSGIDSFPTAMTGMRTTFLTAAAMPAIRAGFW